MQLNFLSVVFVCSNIVSAAHAPDTTISCGFIPTWQHIKWIIFNSGELSCICKAYSTAVLYSEEFS